LAPVDSTAWHRILAPRRQSHRKMRSMWGCAYRRTMPAGSGLRLVC
jgi:hypothetical protein